MHRSRGPLWRRGAVHAPCRSLEIKNKRSIVDSLDVYTQSELLEGDNKFYCDTCGAHMTAVKRTVIKTLPQYLMLHLKRFEFDFRTYRNRKIDDRCEFPLELDMTKYISVSGQPSPPPGTYIYELEGVLVHSGTADSGHYYSYCMDRMAKNQVQSVVWCGAVWGGAVHVCVCVCVCVCVRACVCAEGAVSKRQWPGWSCTNGRREGCVSERAPCVVCCAPVAEGRHPLSPSLALAAGLPRGRPAALFDGATEVLGGPCPRCLRALWWGIDEAGTWAAKILQHTATLPWGCGQEC